jgi:elongation factor Ts
VAPYKPSAPEVKALREKTGAGMMDVRNALEEAEGDEGKAIEILRKKGAASAAKRGGRSTEEGVVASYVHADSRKGALVEIQSETDFVARNPEFQEFARQVAIQVTALNPQHVSFEEIPEEDVANERRILEERAKAEGKPDNVIEKIVEGQLRKWAAEIVLLDQQHFNQEVYEGKTIEDLRSELAAKTGENVRIARFARFEVGQE